MKNASRLSGYRVRVATGAELPAAREAWNALADRMQYPTPFCSWEWVTAWLEVFGREVEPLVLFVCRDDEIIGILPLGVRRSPAFQRWLAGGTLEILGTAHVGADHLDLIVAPADAEPCAEAIDRWLLDASHRWREWRCPLITDQSLLHPSAGRLVERAHSRVQVRSKAPYLPIAGNFEQYLQTLSSKERYKLRAQSQKLLAQPGVVYCNFDRNSREAALTRLFQLHELRAGEKAIASTFGSERIRLFHRALLDRLPWDRVVLRGLRRDDEVFAMFYGFRVSGRIFFFQNGYDPAWSDASPGVVLVTQTIQEAFNSGCVEYNFLQGDEPYKKTFTKQARPLYECRYYPKRAGGRIVYGMQLTRDWIVQREGQVRHGVKSRVTATVSHTSQLLGEETRG